ncbi:MAG: phosphoglucosamine mutase [Bacteroidota bacterium]
MSLIKSISGIRGTIGGFAGENLTPQDIVECTAAYGSWLLQQKANPKVVIGRDARISGAIVNQLVCATLQSLGIDVVDLGLSTTPTVEMAVPVEEAGGGIILTASHNPRQWNALKLLNHRGEFISAEDGRELLEFIRAAKIEYVSVEQLGTYTQAEGYMQKHIDAIFALPLVKKDLVAERKFKVVVDAVNSTGAISIVPLLEQLGCEVILINGDMSGHFAHNPEPLPENLTELASAVLFHKADLGVAVDPDVDRLALVCEDGEMFGEEYTLVAVADYILQHKKGPTVSNLSSSRALRDVTQKHQCDYHASAVGEVNVVNKMKAVEAVIGGEGNGGIIYPALHYGRDALVGVALILSQLVQYKKPLSFLRKSYPNYTISKNKIQLTPDINLELLLELLKKKYQNEEINTTDGLKIDFETGWIHLRKSNTEPIIRIYTESTSEVIANNLADKIKADINVILREIEKMPV